MTVARYEWLPRQTVNVNRAAVTQYGGKVERAGPEWEGEGLVRTGILCNLTSLSNPKAAKYQTTRTIV